MINEIEIYVFATMYKGKDIGFIVLCHVMRLTGADYLIPLGGWDEKKNVQQRMEIK